MDTAKLNSKQQAAVEDTNVAFRVLADHARATAFLMADGVLPSNDGRGYVLRRIMRRAIRYGRKLSKEQNLFPAVVAKVIETMSATYPELSQQKSLIQTNVNDEEQRFLTTLDQGTHILSKELERLSQTGSKTVSGELAFKLYDTFGFPIDLTRIMAAEQNFEVNENDFDKHMQQAREKAKSSWKAKLISTDDAHLIKLAQDIHREYGPTQFLGYGGTTEATGEILVLSSGSDLTNKLDCNQEGLILLDRTCFYAESGGQVGDSGAIVGPNGTAQVLDTSKHNDIHVHHIKVTDGYFSPGDTCQLNVHRPSRRNTAANHSATHLLHSALRNVLGTHVTQAGSLVEADRLRFDFTHNKPLSMTELQRIERQVNHEISLASDVNTQEMPPDQAIEAGALALFGEKYGDKVRVVKMGETSMELCGGTHVENTAMIRAFKVVSESGVSAGVRRIEAITGDRAVEFLLKNTHENLSAREAVGLKANWSQYLDEDSDSGILAWVEKQRAESKSLQRELQSLKGQGVDIEQIIGSAHPFTVDGEKGQLVTADLQMDDRKLLSDITDKIRDKIQSGVVVVIGKGDGSNPIIVSVTKNLAKNFHAGKILKEVAESMGGKGGGRPDFAQGAAKDRSKIDTAFAKAQEIVGS